MKKTKTYFASDFHLGIPNLKDSHKRERLIVNWLNEIKEDAKSIFFLGDIFDFWFEYKKVVPKGFIRLLGKLAELSDSGTEIHLLVGNHDMWMKDYLIKEIGVQIHYLPVHLQPYYQQFGFSIGDWVAYRCSGCGDRWDLEIGENTDESRDTKDQ